MGATTLGFPYPEPTDPVAAGADAIKALAQALDIATPRLYVATGTAQTGIDATPVVVATLAVPAQGRAGRVHVTAYLRIQKSVPADNFVVNVKHGALITVTMQSRDRKDDAYAFYSVAGYFTLAANTAITITTELSRVTGSGSASTAAAASTNNLTALWVPT